jgi:hypothetical protein
VEKDEAAGIVVEDVVVEENEEDTLAAVVGAEGIVEVEEAVEDAGDHRESLEGECLFLMFVVVVHRSSSSLYALWMFTRAFVFHA